MIVELLQKSNKKLLAPVTVTTPSLNEYESQKGEPRGTQKGASTEYYVLNTP